MTNKLWYMNTETGVLTDSHAIAIMWFNRKVTLNLMQVRNGEWVKRGSWEW